MTNSNLHNGKRNKNDEFYTQLTDIEKELWNYIDHFENKTVLCNCDDPEESKFWQFFAERFESWKLKKLISTHYDKDKQTYSLEIMEDINNDGRINRKDTIKTPLTGDGDFRSQECIDLLKEADIVVTNPPFSLFREYVAQLMEYKKKFLIIGNINAVTYKEIFPLIKDGKIWAGNSFNKTMEFRLSDEYKKWNRIGEDGKKYGKVPCIAWYTNLTHNKRNEELLLYKEYSPEEYPKYDNYDAIEVSKVKDIPIDYAGVMGVPITFLGKYNPEQFEIVGLDDHRLVYPEWRGRGPDLNGKKVYRRIMIKHKKEVI